MTPAPRRLLPTGLLTGLAALVLLPAGGAQAAVPPACGSLDLDDPTAVVANAEGTDDVFIGRVARIDTGTPAGGASASATPTQPADPTGSASATPGAGRVVTHEVVVEDALTGDLRPGQQVRVVLATADGEQTRLKANANYIFFTTGTEGLLRADGCDGYVSARGLDATTVDVLRSALAGDDGSADVELSEPPGGSDGPPELGRVVAPGAAISLIGVLGLVLLSRVGRQRP